ncbi:MAG TPA: hypothetical protein VH255_03285 [Verrucomicrobiae bacterium]|jgi:Trp operon repressor|nr:hypothetical protein [Verrucomicrobiae bacterium]
MDPTPNPTLQQIQAMLLTQSNALKKAFDDANDANTMDTIMTQKKEVLHRIDIVQNLLFKQSSQALAATLPGITTANDALTKAISGINDIAAFVTSASNFLQAVDQAITIAKALSA